MIYLEALKKILIEAGEILIELQNNIKSEIKFDNTWLTDADLKIEEFLKLELSRIEPKATFLGEESQDAESCLMWVVDPIDGTKAYKQGLEDYAIAVSLVKEDSPVMGAVYRPAQEQLFFC